MTPRFIAQCLVGCVALLGVTTLVRGRARVAGRPDVALSMVREQPQATPEEQALAARRRIIIEPLPVPLVTVKLSNVNTQETATFHIGREGEVTADEGAAIEQFFRCRRSGRHMTMAPGVLAMLADVAKRWPGRTIEVVSGFRAPPFGAPHSKHFRGHAMDWRPGEPDTAWTATDEEGVPNYHPRWALRARRAKKDRGGLGHAAPSLAA